jgi:uncharacterized protein YndB with AHSA1/START domain
MIVKTAVLRCAPAHAFVVFTEQAGHWWPPERRHTRDADSDVLIEATGRFYERARDGAEVELGVVREFDPPHRLVLDWYPGTGPANPTRVEVAFAPHGEDTQVTITHSVGPAGDDLFTRNAPAYDRSWNLVLGSLVVYVASQLDQR